MKNGNATAAPSETTTSGRHRGSIRAASMKFRSALRMLRVVG